VTSLARHVAGVDLADDVAQAAFVALWRHRGQYRAERGTPRSWLLTIVRHRAIDQLRSRTARQSHTMCMDPEGWIGIADEGPSAEPAHVHVERSESRAAIRRLLATLPPEQRGVVELSYFGGLSQQEIANRLEIPLGTVKGRLRLALQKLRAGWDQGEDARPDRMLAAA
jgi:RNA polymerase sigma-70 factor (ECF subfamily)